MDEGNGADSGGTATEQKEGNMAQQTKLGKLATRIIRQGEWTLVKYHDTVVVSFNDKWIVLDTGGWFTPTTKTRMNQASNQFGLGYQVYQREGEWNVCYGTGKLTFIKNQCTIRRDQ
jgi:hypothetical protein